MPNSLHIEPILLGWGGTDLGSTLIKALAVVGAAAVGGIGAGMLLHLLARALVHRSAPRPAVVVVRLLGAVAVGLAVGLLLFQKGDGLMGGRGEGWWPFGQGGGGGASHEKSTSTSYVSHPESNGKQADFITVQMLGGAEPEKDGRFYVVDGKPMTLDEVEKDMESRRKQTPSLKVIVIATSGKSVDSGNPAVIQFKDWAEKHRFETRMVGP